MIVLSEIYAIRCLSVVFILAVIIAPSIHLPVSHCLMNKGHYTVRLPEMFHTNAMSCISKFSRIHLFNLPRSNCIQQQGWNVRNLGSEMLRYKAGSKSRSYFGGGISKKPVGV